VLETKTQELNEKKKKRPSFDHRRGSWDGEGMPLELPGLVRAASTPGEGRKRRGMSTSENLQQVLMSLTKNDGRDYDEAMDNESSGHANGMYESGGYEGGRAIRPSEYEGYPFMHDSAGGRNSGREDASVTILEAEVDVTGAPLEGRVRANTLGRATQQSMYYKFKHMHWGDSYVYAACSGCIGALSVLLASCASKTLILAFQGNNQFKTYR
jgi:hypothetical protein